MRFDNAAGLTECKLCVCFCYTDEAGEVTNGDMVELGDVFAISTATRAAAAAGEGGGRGGRSRRKTRSNNVRAIYQS